MTGHHARAGLVLVFRDGLLNQLSKCSLGPNLWLLLVQERYVIHACSVAVRLRAIIIGLDVLFFSRPQVVTGSQRSLPLEAVKDVAGRFGAAVGTSKLASQAQVWKNMGMLVFIAFVQSTRVAWRQKQYRKKTGTENTT